MTEVPPARSYGQFCALARALDVVGERWTLLIVRELFAGDCRYSDLRESLPGIATNLLANRLRQLQAAGLVEAHEAPRPVRATVYRLTERGRGLGPVLRALVEWGTPLVAEGQGDDEFRTHWMALAMPILFDGVDVSDVAPLSVRVDTGDESASLVVEGSRVRMWTGEPDSEPDVVVSGAPEDVFGFLVGRPGSSSARLEVQGPREAVGRLRLLTSRMHTAAAGERQTA